MANDTQNFKAAEFACHCCGKNNISQAVIDMAQILRFKLKVPIRVNSGYRCDKHNAEVGGVKGSNHTKGLAADLSCSLGADAMFAAMKQLHSQGLLPQLGYCIRYKRKNFIHVDTVKRKSGNIWEERS